MYTTLDHLIDVIPLPDIGPVHLAMAMPNEAYRADSQLPRAALPETGRLASGRGLSAEQCLLSCRGEAAELLSCCVWGDEQLVSATQRELGPVALSPGMLNGFSATQIEQREAWNAKYGGFDWRPPGTHPDVPLAWMEVRDAFSGKPAYAPADFMLLGRREAGDAEAVSIADSNGCAAGPSMESARLSAVLELIERDATAQWWYGRRPVARPDHGTLDDPVLTHWLGARARRTWLLDISTELAVPVVAAVSADSNGRDVAMGFSARPSWSAALASAVTEMVQMEFSLDLARSPAAPAHWRVWRQHATMTKSPLNAEAPSRERPAAAQAITLETILESFKANGVDLWFAEMSRATIGVPVVRAISTVLCHYKPRLARARVLEPTDGPGKESDLERHLPLLV